MTTTRAACLLSVLAVACGLARDARAVKVFVSGNYLYSLCTGTNYNECLGYVEGTMDAEALRPTFSPEVDVIRRWCEPSGITDRQAVDVVVLYLRSHPESRHLDATELIGDALSGAWPCPARPSP
jgi:hypothetical protein